MKILITGSSGLLGSELVHHFSSHDLLLPSHSSLDITDEAKVLGFCRENKPDLIFNCAADTDVDGCESRPERAFLTNAIGARNVGLGSQACGARLIHFSTDYVFDGLLDRPYNEFDVANGGFSVYGKTKFQGEKYIRQVCNNYLVVRTAWLYGKGGKNFVDTMLRISNEGRKEIKVVNDQVGNPTSTRAVARALDTLLSCSYSGDVHLTCEGAVSWFEFAKKIFELSGVKQCLLPCSSLGFTSRATRPTNSNLEKRVLKLLGLPKMKDWEIELKDFLSTQLKTNF